MDTAQSDAMLREAMSGSRKQQQQQQRKCRSFARAQVAPLTGRLTTSTGETTIGLRIDGITPRKRKPAVSHESEYGIETGRETSIDEY